MSVNLDGPFMICQMAEKFLKNSSNGASVIQLSSVYGVISPDNRIYKGSKFLNREITSPVVYGVSKSAIIGLSRYLSTYWAKLNIRVNSISPGGIESGQNIKFKKKYSKRVPMNRMALSREIVSVILFLSSEDSSYINGQNIIVDGGLTIW
jgi:NAD(P)-dependent dehydrogenase (short-subunit alcohol dehydrogenase family)